MRETSGKKDKQLNLYFERFSILINLDSTDWKWNSETESCYFKSLQFLLHPCATCLDCFHFWEVQMFSLCQTKYINLWITFKQFCISTISVELILRCKITEVTAIKPESDSNQICNFSELFLCKYPWILKRPNYFMFILYLYIFSILL